VRVDLRPLSAARLEREIPVGWQDSSLIALT
jgi:hypothetical protein